MSELLVELFSEEIPARMQNAAAQNFLKNLEEGLKKSGLAFGASAYFYTPRRLAAHITGIPAAREAQREEIKGPRTDSAPAAVQGFLRKNGLDKPEQCNIKTIDGVDYYFVVKTQAGGQTADSLGPLITKAIEQVTWPKSMRWGYTSVRWARPLHNVLAVFEGAVVAGTLALGDNRTLTFNNQTRGHRFLSKGTPFAVNDIAGYKKSLLDAGVILDQNERREKIWSDVQSVAKQNGFTVKEDDKLLDEIVGLVEWPVPFMGTFDAEFLDIPAEVISTSMRENQRYFTVLDSQSKITNRFICVANVQPTDGGKTILHGNEKVLRARLSDARFFWDQDKKIKLPGFLPRLDQVRFHEKLGTMGEKTARLEELAEKIAGLIKADAGQAARAAQLAKADLVTNMVREFPELQGVMGGYYAALAGEPKSVAAAISTHYSPAGPNDPCPTAPVSVAVALADKIDTLVGFFSIGEKPTGSKDPFALRRAALGVIRLILENKLSLSMKGLIETAARLCPGQKAEGLMEFIADRFRVLMIDQAVPHKVVEAVLRPGQLDNLFQIQEKITKLAAFLNTDDGAKLLAIIKRVRSILDSTKDKITTAPDEKQFQAPEEQALGVAIKQVTAPFKQGIQSGDWTAAMRQLLPLQAPVDGFFDRVTVMDKDEGVRKNRLALLASLCALFDEIADFQAILK